MQGMHELCQPERVFQDPRKEEGLMEAQFIWGEEKEVEEELEVQGIRSSPKSESLNKINTAFFERPKYQSVLPKKEIFREREHIPWLP